MKLYKTKIGRIFNFIKNEGKLEFGDKVQIIKNNSKYDKYNKYINKYGILRNIDYSKKECMFEIRFEDGYTYGFDFNELRKISDEEYFKHLGKYKKIFDKIKF